MQKPDSRDSASSQNARDMAMYNETCLHCMAARHEGTSSAGAAQNAMSLLCTTILEKMLSAKDFGGCHRQYLSFFGARHVNFTFSTSLH